MNRTIDVIAGSDLVERPRRSRWPARLDYFQSASGLLLALFMWFHMAFVATILLSQDALYAVAKMFEGDFLFGHGNPNPLTLPRFGVSIPVTLVVAVVFFLVIAHAFLAMRKFPANFRQLRTFRGHMAMMNHEDTTLWFTQAFTGFALFFLASAHLFIMLTHSAQIGPYESSYRVWQENMWPWYALLLLAVEFHGGIGLYRLAVKWDWFGGANPGKARHRLKVLKWAITVFLLVIGFATLGALMKLGHYYQSHPGERYQPKWEQHAPGAAPPAAPAEAGGNR